MLENIVLSKQETNIANAFSANVFMAIKTVFISALFSKVYNQVDDGILLKND